MRYDRTESHVREWAELVDEDVPEAIRDDDEDGERDRFRSSGR